MDDSDSDSDDSFVFDVPVEGFEDEVAKLKPGDDWVKPPAIAAFGHNTASSAAGQAPNAAEGLWQWRCPHCQVGNSPDDPECIGCEKEKPPHIQAVLNDPAALWVCSGAGCTMQNPNRADKCVVCATPNPRPIPKSARWTCACGYTNEAAALCIECEAPSPFLDDTAKRPSTPQPVTPATPTRGGRVKTARRGGGRFLGLQLPRRAAVIEGDAERPRTPGATINAPCAHCRKQPRGLDNMFCSEACKAAWNATNQGPPKVINLNISPNNKRVEEAHRERVRERLVTVLNMQMPLVKDPRIRKSMPPAADLAKAIEEAFFYELQNDVDKYRTRSTGLVDVLDFENGRPKDPGSFDLVARLATGRLTPEQLAKIDLDQLGDSVSTEATSANKHAPGPGPAPAPQPPALPCKVRMTFSLRDNTSVTIPFAVRDVPNFDHAGVVFKSHAWSVWRTPPQNEVYNYIDQIYIADPSQTTTELRVMVAQYDGGGSLEAAQWIRVVDEYHRQPIELNPHELGYIPIAVPGLADGGGGGGVPRVVRHAYLITHIYGVDKGCPALASIVLDGLPMKQPILYLVVVVGRVKGKDRGGGQPVHTHTGGHARDLAAGPSPWYGDTTPPHDMDGHFHGRLAPLGAVWNKIEASKFPGR